MSERRSSRPRRAPRQPRRRSQTQLSGPRPDLVAAWAVALGIFLVLVASATSQGASSGESGGARLPAPQKTTVTHQSRAPIMIDDRTRSALSSIGSELGLQAAEIETEIGRRAIARHMRLQLATWYGPGLYGNRTACGVRLRRTTLGVAHRRLPCGTLVTLHHRGAFQTVPVVDRGPFSAKIGWDLTAATARKLGFGRTGRIRVAH